MSDLNNNVNVAEIDNENSKALGEFGASNHVKVTLLNRPKRILFKIND